MPVSSTHKDYAPAAQVWRSCRDVMGGERTVKAAGSRYLPKLRAQKPEDYENYKLRASFFNITAKTLTALTGLVMAKPVITQYEELLAPYFEDTEGYQLVELVGLSIQEVLLMGRIGLMVDAPVGGGKPSIVTYLAESIINWGTASDGTLNWVVLKEVVEQQVGSDRFVTETVTQYRLLELLEGVYTFSVFSDTGSLLEGPTAPMVRDQPLAEIPFLVLNPIGVGMRIEKPPMEDIVNMNLSLYRTSADLEWGRHFTGLPTPVVSGVDASTTLTIGGTQAWIIPNAEGRAAYLEFTGQGLQSLEKAITEKQGQLATMSARMIDQSTRGSESAEAVRLRYLSESSTLTQICNATEKAMNIVYGWLAMFVGAEAPTITLPKEFLSDKLTPAELTALVESYLKGTIDKQTFIYNLRRGDMLDPQRTDDDVIKSIIATPGSSVVKPQPNNSEGA